MTATVPLSTSATRRPRRGQNGGRPEDAQVLDLLLALVRLIRAPRRRPPGWALPAPLAALLAEGTLAPRHLSVLVVISQEGPLSVSELARREGWATTTASLLVTQLADCGLVERHADALDRRRTVVSVAAPHRSEIEAMARARLAPARRALQRLGPAGAQSLVEGINLLVEEVERGEITGPVAGLEVLP